MTTGEQTSQKDRVGWDPLRVTEIFYSIQGESTDAGRPCVFVRLSRCNLRCEWCDTPYSFHGGDKLSRRAIRDKVAEYDCNLVELTGGEPLLQPGAEELMTELCDDGYEVMIETSGSRDISGVDDRVKVVMDLKAPGSGMAENNKYENIQHLGSDDEVKFVILDRADFEWSLETIDEWNLTDVCDVIFSPVHDELEPGTLANWLLDAHQAGIRIGLQIHKYLGME